MNANRYTNGHSTADTGITMIVNNDELSLNYPEEAQNFQHGGLCMIQERCHQGFCIKKRENEGLHADKQPEVPANQPTA